MPKTGRIDLRIFSSMKQRGMAKSECQQNSAEVCHRASRSALLANVPLSLANSQERLPVC
jgi:hypothetical protein